MDSHLPVLQVILPLTAAPLCVLLRGRRRLAHGFALVVSWATFAIAVTLLARVLDSGPITYALGGWAAPYGIELRVDILSAFVLVFVAAIGSVVLTYAPASLARELPEDRQRLFLSIYLLSLTGLLGIAVTGDLFNLFVFLEISSISSYAMVSLGRDRRALTAAFQYLVMGTIGATFLLIGIGLMYMMTGTLNMADMAVRLDAVEQTRTVLAAFGFLSVGICLKIALFPLHAWLPNAYTYAPSVVGAFLAATATKVAVYILVRFVFTIYGAQFAFDTVSLGEILMPVAIVAAFVCSTVAIFQNNIKRMLAYSSLAQIGYMVLGISFCSVSGLTAGIVHLFNHALTKGGLFLAMGCIAVATGSVQLEDLKGLGRRMPAVALAWLFGGLGLIGVPLTAGFVTKWYLIRAALETGRWPIAALVLVSSLLAVVYVWRVVEVFYFRDPPKGALPRTPWSMLLPTWILIGASLVFGVAATLSVGVAQRAASALLGIAP